eukprot:6186622-Pleurochrysis_carterae.AAC.2
MARNQTQAERRYVLGAQSMPHAWRVEASSTSVKDSKDNKAADRLPASATRSPRRQHSKRNSFYKSTSANQNNEPK